MFTDTRILNTYVFVQSIGNEFTFKSEEESHEEQGQELPGEGKDVNKKRKGKRGMLTQRMKMRKSGQGSMATRSEKKTCQKSDGIASSKN